jgi:hypothetical protein
MSWREDREGRAGGRRAELENLAPGTGVRVLFDRGAWSALSQGAPGTWSWSKAVLTIGLSIGVAIVIYLTVYREVAWLIGLALAYAVLLWRARRVHADYLDRRGS